MALTATVAGAEDSAAPVEVPSMLIKLIEQRDVSARVEGQLAAVKVREGDLVEAGAVLAQIDDSEARTAENRTQVELEVAKSNAKNDVNVRFAAKAVEVSKAELKRSLDSNAKYAKSVSESELDRLRLLVEKSSLETEQAAHEFAVAGYTLKIKENECQAAQQKLERHKIVAPIAGIVVQVNRRGGEWVKPGDPVLRILRIDRLRAEGYLKAAALSRASQGQAVKLVVDLPGAPAAVFPGKVVFLDPEMDPVNAQVRIWAEVENEGLRLRPGMRAKMLLEGPAADGKPKP
jgi:macrolide-specific efflux system membrane fusion protein